MLNNQKNIVLKKQPSMVYTIWQGLRNTGKNSSPEKHIPNLSIAWPGVCISPKHLQAFCRICDIPIDFPMPFLYPFTFAYPCMLRLVSQSVFPFSMFKMLHVRSQTTVYRPMSENDLLNITCTTSDQRQLIKGIEFDLQTCIRVHRETVWENTSTFFVRKKADVKESAFKPRRLTNIDHAEIIDKWYLPAKDRFGFARISGDSNGIHYSKRYAKMLGFQRDYAQPLRVAAKCIETLPRSMDHELIRLHLHYKGPVYYNNELTLKYQETEEGQRFDLFCEGNRKPCIRGMMEFI